MLFLHGFPEFWYSWRHQLAEFGRDHLAVAIDMRGYNHSDKPTGLEPYAIPRLVEDVRAVIETLGGGRATLLAHDWGGGVAWAFAYTHPQMLERLIIVNCPHPVRLAQELRRPRQLLKSWYMFVFQLPGLPEWALTRKGAAIFDAIVRAHPNTFSEEDIRAYKAAILRPGAATGAVNYYRSLFRTRPLPALASRPPLEVPTLLLWGEKDPYLGKSITNGMEPYLTDLTIRYLPDAGHFVQEERPQEVNLLVRDFLAR